MQVNNSLAAVLIGGNAIEGGRGGHSGRGAGRVLHDLPHGDPDHDRHRRGRQADRSGAGDLCSGGRAKHGQKGLRRGRMNIGVNQFCFPMSYDVADAVKAAKRLGFDSIEACFYGGGRRPARRRRDRTRWTSAATTTGC